MGWTMLYLFVALKIPIVAAIWIVYWAVKQVPDPEEDTRDDGGTRRKRPHPIPRRGPKPPRRDPHGAPEPPSPPRIRTVKARGRQIKR
jgi:hypothetical protein